MAKITGNEDLLNLDLSPREKARIASGIGDSTYKADISQRVGEFSIDSKYDAGILAGQNQQALRAERQPGTEQALYGVVGGLTSGLITAAEDGSYLLDFDNHIKALQGLDTNEKNWLAKWAEETKQDLSKAMPIYRKDPSEVFDFSDPGFYWESLKGILDSAVGFGLPGGVVAKGVSTAMRATKISKLIELASRGNAMAVRAAESLGAGAVQIYAEGKMLALETYESTLEELRGQVEKGELDLSENEIKRVAGESANNVLSYNRAFILSDAFGLHGLMKGVGTTRNLLKQRGLANRFKQFGESLIAPNTDNLILQGLKESAEEIGQGVLQKEQEYQALKLSGADVSKYDDLIGNRLFDFATDDSTLLEGMMGFFGGGPQRILSEATSGNLTKSAREQYEKQYANQQATIAQSADFIQGKVEKYNSILDERDAALQAGDEGLAKAKEKEIFTDMAIQNFVNGTTEEFEKQLQDIASGNVSEEVKATWGDNAQSKATEFLNDLKQLEKEYIKNSDKANVSEIVYAKSHYDAMKERRDIAETKLAEYQSEVKESINDLLKTTKFKDIKKGDDKEASSFSYDINNLEKNPYNPKTDKAAYAQYNSFLKRLAPSQSYQDYIKLHTFLNKDITVDGKKRPSFYNQVDNAREAYELTKTKPAEAAFVNRVNKIRENAAKEAAAKANETEIPSDELVKGKKYKDSKGKEFVYEGTNDIGNFKMKDPITGVTRIFNPKQFNDAFKTQGTFTAKASKEEAENIKTKEAATKAQATAKNKAPETKTTIEKKVTRAAEKEAIQEIKEPSNDNTEKDVSTKDSFKSKNPLSIAWYSANNTFSKGGHPDITSFFEQKNSNVVGTSVEFKIELPLVTESQKTEEWYTIAKNIQDRFNNRESLSEEEKASLIEDIVNNGNISITLIGQDGSTITENSTPIKASLHLPNYINEVEYQTQMKTMRTQIASSLVNNKPVVSTITSKANGTIQTEEEYKSIQNLFNSHTDIELVIRDQYGAFVKGSQDGNVVYDEDLDSYSNPEGQAGAVYVKTITANGSSFPMRVKIPTVNSEEGELIYMVYSQLLNKEVNPLSPLSLDINKEILMFVKDSGDSRVNSLIKLLPNKEDSTLLDLLNILVYEGAETLTKSNDPLFVKDGKIQYGWNAATDEPFFIGRSDLKDMGKKDNFLNWITENKLRNIQFKRINEPAYKKYLFDNALLTSNAKRSDIEENGPMFAQPTVTISSPEIETKKDKSMEEVIEYYEDDGFAAAEALWAATEGKKLQAVEEVPYQPSQLTGEQVSIEEARQDLDIWIKELQSGLVYTNEALLGIASELDAQLDLYSDNNKISIQDIATIKNDLIEQLKNC